MIPRALTYQAVIVAILSGLAYYLGAPQHAIATLVGGTLMAANLALVIWTWNRILMKKSIALAASVIVFKYAILGVIIFIVIGHHMLNVVGFLIGLASIVPTVMLIALQHNTELKSNT